MSRLIYFVRNDGTGQIKIGSSIGLKARLCAIRSYCRPHSITLLGITEGGYNEEFELHERFAEYRDKSGRGRGRSEWFWPGLEILDFIKANTHLNIPKRQYYDDNPENNYRSPTEYRNHPNGNRHSYR
jgi:hypothetical protein